MFVGPGAEKQLQTDRDVLEHEFVEVAGIGDEAWQEDSWIFVRSGELWMSITVISLDDPARFVSPLQEAAKVLEAALATA